MRNQKKFLAVLTATTVMLSSTSAFAATETSGSNTGAGTVENNASTVPSYNQIVLPTMPDNTYDFTLDPTGLLHTYNPDLYPTAGTFYFHSLKTPATLTNKDSGSTTDGKLYYATKKASDTDTLKAALTASSSSISQITGNFYVWIPDAVSQIGGGKYLLLDTSNIGNYFDITIDTNGTTITAVAFKSTIKSGTYVCDGKVYADGYKELPSSYDVSDYVTIKDGAIDKTQSINLAYADTSSTNFTAIDSANVDNYVKYTAPVVDYQGTSDKTTIVNKSTVDTTVTATVTVTNPGTLNFVSDKAFTSDTNTSVYLAITDGSGSNATPVELKDGVVTAEATFNLDAVDTSSAITYQSTQTDDKTGGHVYKQYEAPDVTYDKVSFYLEGAANSSADADWDAYSESLTSTTRPSIEVVYSFKNTFGDPEVPEVTDDYVIKVNADGTASYTFVNAPDTDATGLTAIAGDGTSYPQAITNNVVTYSDGTITFNSGAINNWLGKASTVTATINGKEVSFTVDNPYILEITSGTMTYTFDEELAPSDAISGGTTNNNFDITAGISSNNVTYNTDTGVLTFSAAACTNWASASSYVDIKFGDSTTIHFLIIVK